ncbi:deaminase [Heliobacillus mobilis]|uniref:Deaminase n=2 Tax=Heliobacterium TaxID=2697 RepID=A0A6I3SLQ5_HELMO|nr:MULTISPECIES: cytidine/deoxycytidylate deaminase family protein [Heliobacterium]MBC9784526.1 cytidine/deoxycytidylate deaminase family protein [Heliobacterium chlorum]MTV49572.1 deaminase [Heliobacterium mobile]
MRKDWDSYFLDIAFEVASRSTCPRRSVGAVIVKDKRIKATGYNGSPARLPHCADEGCYMLNHHCIRTIHAEVNALLECAPDDRKGATVYVTDRPCAECSKLLISTGISRVVFARDYHTDCDWFALAPWMEVVHKPTREKGDE